MGWQELCWLPRWGSSKESACQCRRHKRPMFDPWVGKILWRRKWQPTPAVLSGEFHGQRRHKGYSPWGCRVRQDWARTHKSYCYNLTGENLSQSVRVGLQSQFPPFTLVGPTVTRGESPGDGATRMSVYKADTKCQKYLHHCYSLEKPKVCLVTTLPSASLVKGLQELPAKLHFTYLAHQGDLLTASSTSFPSFNCPADFGAKKCSPHMTLSSTSYLHPLNGLQLKSGYNRVDWNSEHFYPIKKWHKLWLAF